MLSFIRRYWLFVVLIVVSAYAVYNYQQANQSPCDTPLYYNIGTFDNRFGISRADFLDAVAQAVAIWEKPFGKQLFIYSSTHTPDFLINLVYDERQASTQKDATLTSTIDQGNQTAQSVKEQYSSLENQYNEANQTYQTDLKNFNAKQNNYNAQVVYWNSRGGASGSEYTTLTATKSALQTEANTLNQEKDSINSLADQINALIDKYNLLVDHINANVAVVNNGAGEEFEEGEYVHDASGSRINIYEFSDRDKLVRVLAHELGHALGLGHNTNPNSIMYALNQSTTLALSPDDLQELDALCGVK